MKKVLDFIKTATIISCVTLIFCAWCAKYANEGADNEYVETMTPEWRKAVKDELRKELGREPSTKEIADYVKR